MAWQTTIPVPPPVKPNVTGWFAVLNVLSKQEFTIQDMATLLGYTSCLQYLVFAHKFLATGYQSGVSTTNISNRLDVVGKPVSSEQFYLTEIAGSKGVVSVNNSISFVELASVITYISALQNLILNNPALAKGLQNALQNCFLSDASLVSGIEKGNNQFSLNESALNVGAIAVLNSLFIQQTATIISLTYANQSVLLNNVLYAMGVQNAIQSFFINSGLTSFASVVGAANNFNILNLATTVGLTAIINSFNLTNLTSNVGFASLSQQFYLNNAGVITASEAKVKGDTSLALIQNALTTALLFAMNAIVMANTSRLVGLTLLLQNLSFAETANPVASPKSAQSLVLDNSAKATNVNNNSIPYTIPFTIQ